MSHWEPRCAGQFDLCITVSEPDRRLLLAANPDLRVEVVPNGVDTHKYQPLAVEDISTVLNFSRQHELFPVCGCGPLLLQSDTSPT